MHRASSTFFSRNGLIMIDTYIVANGGARLIARYHRGSFSSAPKTLENKSCLRTVDSLLMQMQKNPKCHWGICEATENIHTLCLNSQTPFIDNSF